MKISNDPHHLILYDGLCGLCHRLNRFVIKRDRPGIYLFASQQSDLGQELLSSHGFDPDKLETFLLVTNYKTDEEELLFRSRAGLFIASSLGWPWKAASILKMLPTSWCDALYNIVARNRYRLFGKYDTCPLPDERTKERFLNV